MATGSFQIKDQYYVTLLGLSSNHCVLFSAEQLSKKELKKLLKKEKKRFEKEEKKREERIKKGEDPGTWLFNQLSPLAGLLQQKDYDGE